MESSQMPRVDMGKNLSNMSEVEQHYIKKLEALNFERANKMRKMRTRNRMIGCILAGVVLGGYAYTLFGVKQEKFLDFEQKPAEVRKD